MATKGNIRIPFWMGAQRLKLIERDTELLVVQDARNVIYGGPLLTLVFALLVLALPQESPSPEQMFALIAFALLPAALLIPLGLYFHRQPPVIIWRSANRQLSVPRYGLTTDAAHATTSLRIEQHDDPEGSGTFPVLTWRLHTAPESDETLLFICQRQKHLRAVAEAFATRTCVALTDVSR